MFCSDPIHTPSIPVRRSPKYFQVSESGPSGVGVAGRVVVVDLIVTSVLRGAHSRASDVHPR
jgi:hypothetical protein